MKIYKFYRKPSEEVRNSPNYTMQQKYPLYAITPEKKLAKKFKKSRNMNMFIERVDDVDSDIADKYIHKHRDKIIESLEVETVVNKNLSNEEIKYVEIIVTESEYECVTEYSDTGRGIGVIVKPYNWFPMNIFENELYKILKMLKYDICSKFMNSISDDEFLSADIKLDFLSIFIIIHESLLSENFYNSLEFMDFPKSNNIVHL